MKSQNNDQLGLAACLFPIQSGQDHAVQLFPAGQFTAPEGALQGEGPWYLDADIASQVMAALSGNNHILIDYEHQSLLFTENHQPLEAAGTFAGTGLEWREGQGLFATGVEWAATAKAHFKDNQFRFISPLFTYNKATGAVKNLISVAVTDNPAIKNMRAIELAAASLTNQPEDTMNKQLLALLGLTDTASDEEVLAACKALQQSANQVETLTDQIAALKANAENKPDPSKFVSVDVMNELKDQVAALSEQVDNKAKFELIIAALADGRLLEAQKPWAESLDVAALTAYLDTAQPIAALRGTQTGGKDPVETDENGLTQDELAVCTATGISPEDFKKSKGDA